MPSLEKSLSNGPAVSSLPSNPRDQFAHLPPYAPPTTPLFRILPTALVPYAELMRLHRPAGYYAFYFPHLFGTLYASVLSPSPPSPTTLLHANLLFAAGSIILRGAACTWNDVCDADYDRQVARCRHRPVARRAVSPLQAHCFTCAQSIIGLGLLYQLPREVLPPAALLVSTMAFYPFCKRFTNYPQVVLGFSFALGQLVGAAAMGFDIRGEHNTAVIGGVACLYLANVLNTIIYDAVYAHQDLQDDLRAGVHSVAVAWRDNTKPILSVLATLEVGLLASAGYYFDLGPLYLCGAVAGTAAVLGSMINRVRLDVRESCYSWFARIIHLTGVTLAGGLCTEYLRRLYGNAGGS